LYYPIQIPYILSKPFAKSILYKEEVIQQFQDFVLCLWEMRPVSGQKAVVGDHIILADGCIDLVADFEKKEIGFAGMSKTVFDDEINAPYCHYGARFKPGAFHAITGIPATEAMDRFLPISSVDAGFDTRSFFALPFAEAKEHFRKYIGTLIMGKDPLLTTLFDTLSDDIPDSVSEIYQRMHYSPKQCQRIFYRHFGLSPQMSLCIIRFQKCLQILTSGASSQNYIMDTLNYYDQSHFINDFKKYIGLTPLELVRKYAG